MNDFKNHISTAILEGSPRPLSFPVSLFSRHVNWIINAVSKSKHPVIITVNSEPNVVILSYQNYITLNNNKEYRDE